MMNQLMSDYRTMYLFNINIRLILLAYIRGYSLIGKTTVLHIVVSGSLPDISKIYFFLLGKLNTVERDIEAVQVISSNLMSSILL